jgi:acetyl esterase/lipase
MRQDDWSDSKAFRPDGYEQEILEYGEFEQQKIYFNFPAGKTACPLVIWLHGGGLTMDTRSYPRDLWNGEYAGAEVRYRISNGTFNALDSLADAAAAVALILKNLNSLNVDPENVFLGGMSAGAYLAAMVDMNPDLLAEHGEDQQKIKGLLLASGQMSTHFQIKKDLHYDSSDYKPVIDEYAPLYYTNQKIAPVLLITGESGLDLPGRPEENAFMAATLRALGHSAVRYYQLPGHDHAGVFDSCDYLLIRFIEDVKNGVLHG